LTDLTAAAQPVAPTTAEKARRSRLWFVDNLRVALICLVVLHHIVVTYSGLPLWYYIEKPTSPAVGLGLTIFLLVDQAWFMGAFFLLSGYFTPSSYERKGTGAFLRDRLIRLGVPLVVFYFVLQPILLLPAYDDGSLAHWYLSAIGSGPLWFVLVLLVLDTAYALTRGVTRDRPARENREAAQPAPPAYWMVVGMALALGLVTYLWRMVVPIGFWIPVVDLPTGAYLPQYIGFFGLGIVAFRRGWFHTITIRMGAFGLGLAVGATLIFLPLGLAGGYATTVGGGTLGSLCYALWDSSVAVGVSLALLAFFRRRLDRSGPLWRYLSNHVYAVYVTHAFIVTAVGYALSVVPVPTLAKVAIAVVVALPACFALAGLVRWLPGMRRVL
jgi:glucan biosynthesis protein C